MTEHSVTYEIPSGTRVITRTVCVSGYRILGTETTTERVYRGYDGWKETSIISATCQFRTREEASAWIDEMFRAWDLAQVAASGGTKLVVLV